MFEFIDPDALAVDEPVADWLGKRFIANAEALAERGWSAGYVWSSELAEDLGLTIREARPAVVSTHPEYWYSIPMIVRTAPQQTTITMIVTAAIVGSVDLCLWVEGVTSAEVAATTGATTLTVTLPPQPAMSLPLRAALLVRSGLGASVYSDAVLDAVTDSLRVDGASFGNLDFHAIVLSDAGGDEWEGFAGETVYHVIRGFGERAYTWPTLDPILTPVGGPLGTTATVYALGTLRLYGLQVYTSNARPQTLPYPAETNAGLPVRAETLRRVASYSRATLLTTAQTAWMGGVGGTLRNTAVSIDSAIRWWGAFFRRGVADLPYVSTVIRARDSVAGIRVTILYMTQSTATLTIDVDGTAVPMTLTGSGVTTDRWTPADGGTLMYTMASRLALDRCSSQDLGFHGASPDASSPDIRRMAMATEIVPWPGTAPSVGDLVPIKVSLGAQTTAALYIGAILIEELPDLTYGAYPEVGPPGLTVFRDITDGQAQSLYSAQNYLYTYAVRCLYSEAPDPPCEFGAYPSAWPVVDFVVRTSPDLPAGTVLRFTVDAEDIDIICGVDATTSTLTFGARSVQTADLAVTSDTVYTLTIAGDVATGSGYIYLLRIEEIEP
jgi:hypothetical protein